MAFWGLKVEPNTWTPFVPPPEEQLRLHISQVRAVDASLPRARDRAASRSRAPPPIAPAAPTPPPAARPPASSLDPPSAIVDRLSPSRRRDC
jgi:hypothetical protein